MTELIAVALFTLLAVAGHLSWRRSLARSASS